MAETFRSVPQMFLHRVGKTPDREAFLFPEGNGWTTLTWRQVGEKVKAIACGLRALGLGDEERASILSATRIDWILADLGILAAGGATTTIYPSSTTPDCLFILQDSGHATPPRREPRAGRPDRREALRGPRREGDRRLRRGRNRRRVRPDAGPADGEGPGVGRRQPGTVRGDRRRRQDRRPRDAHLHLGDDRTPQGRRADARLLALRGGGDRRAEAPQRGRPAVLLAPARPLLRQGPRGGPAPDRLLDGGRRPGREDRREPRTGEADVRRRGAADLREDLQQGHDRREGRRWRQVGHLLLGLRRRPRGLEAPPGRQGARGPPRPEAQGRPRARLLEAPHALRRPPPLLRLRAAPRSPGPSASSSTRRGSSSSRATASRRRAPPAA